MFIKNAEALNYVKSFTEQCKELPELVTEDVAVTMTIFRQPQAGSGRVLSRLYAEFAV